MRAIVLFLFVTAAATLTSAVSVRAADASSLDDAGASRTEKRASHALHTVVYPVADLVAADEPAEPGVDAKPNKEQLETNLREVAEVIRTSVAPASWSEAGGDGYLEFHPGLLCLVIRQTPEQHREIADLLVEMRRLEDVRVEYSVSFVDVPQAQVAALIGDDLDVPHVVRSAERAAWWNSVEQIVGTEHSLSAPKLTLLNGRTGMLGQLGPDQNQILLLNLAA